MADLKISQLSLLATPADDDYMEIVDVSEADVADQNKRIIVPDLVNPAWGYSTKAGSYTLTNLDRSVLFTAVADATLPTAVGIAGRRFWIGRKGSGVITIKTTSAQTVFLRGTAEASASVQLSLFVDGDYLEVESDGANYFVTRDGLQPHVAEMSHAAGTPINDSTLTLIPCDTAVRDNASIVTTGAAAKITVLRAGDYVVVANVLIPNLEDQERVFVYIYKSGNKVRSMSNYLSTAGSNVTLGAFVAARLTLAAADYIDVRVYHEEGAQQTTGTAEDLQPRIALFEVR